MNSVTLEVLRALESDLDGHGIETSVELATTLPPVMGHKGQLQEVIINLVHNAIEAMNSVDGHRVLKVTTELNASDAITIAVEDTGPGLGSEETRCGAPQDEVFVTVAINSNHSHQYREAGFWSTELALTAYRIHR
jgi:C4-dicarboxylate-specific signal transduction histidine kinase